MPPAPYQLHQDQRDQNFAFQTSPDSQTARPARPARPGKVDMMTARYSLLSTSRSRMIQLSSRFSDGSRVGWYLPPLRGCLYPARDSLKRFSFLRGFPTYPGLVRAVHSIISSTTDPLLHDRPFPDCPISDFLKRSSFLADPEQASECCLTPPQLPLFHSEERSNQETPWCPSTGCFSSGTSLFLP